MHSSSIDLFYSNNISLKVSKVRYLQMAFVILFISDFLSKVLLVNGVGLQLSLFARLGLLGFFFFFFAPRKLPLSTLITTLFVLGFFFCTSLVILIGDFEAVSFYTNLKVGVVMIMALLVPFYINFEESKGLMKLLVLIYSFNAIFVLIGVVLNVTYFKMEPLDPWRFGYSGFMPMSGNEVSFLLGCLVFPLYYSFNADKSAKIFMSNKVHFFTLVGLAISLALIGLKSSLLCLLIFLAIVSLKSKKYIVIFALILLVSVVVRYIEEIITAFSYWRFFYEKESLWTFLLSGRNVRMAEILSDLSWFNLVFTGSVPVYNNLEMDPLTLITFYGALPGILLTWLLMKKVLVINMNVVMIGYTLFVLITSTLAGHLIESVFAIVPIMISVIYFKGAFNLQKEC